MTIKKATIILATAITLAATSVLLIDYWVSNSTQNQLYSNIASLPHNKVGLLLGTAKFLRGGVINPYYQSRIDAAIMLFKAGKIDYILVSGDNGEEHYNEPECMKQDLIAAGIPAGRIVQDFAGFRTLDSILRCRIVFGTTEATIISQQFHNERALFIANQKGIKAVAFNAKSISMSASRNAFREKLARVKMLLDLAFGKEAKFYGAPVPIS